MGSDRLLIASESHSELSWLCGVLVHDVHGHPSTAKALAFGSTPGNTAAHRASCRTRCGAFAGRIGGLA